MQKNQKIEINTEAKMQKAQKVLVFTLFALIIAVFVYSLIFMTPFTQVYVYADSNFNFNSRFFISYGLDSQYYLTKYDGITQAFSYHIVTGNINGLDMKYFTAFVRTDGIQVFNHWVFNFGIIGIVVSLLFFIYHSQKRNRYYITNFISIAIVLIFDFYVGFAGIIKLIDARNLVASSDFNLINAYLSSIELSPTLVEHFTMQNCNYIFVIGFIIFIALIVVAAIALAALIGKFIYQKKNPEIDLSGVSFDE